MTSATTLLSRLRARARRGILVEGLALGSAAMIGFMALSFMVDRSLRLEVVYRLGLLVVFLVAVWMLLRRRLVQPMEFDFTDDELALAMERGEGVLGQSLISAVQFERTLAAGNPTSESSELMRRVVDRVYSRLPSLREQSALDLQRIRRFGGIVFGCLFVVGTWGAVGSDSLLLWAKRNLFMSGEEWPRATQLTLVFESENGIVRIAEGNDLTVEVTAEGVVPEQVVIHYQFADGTSGSESMAQINEGAGTDDQGRFTWLLESMISSLTLHATGGDGLSESVEVQLVQRPVLSDIVLTKQFPEYMKREPETIPSGEGDIRIPAGTVIGIRGRSDKALERAFVGFGGEVRRELVLDGGVNGFSGKFPPVESGVLTLDVEDQDGLGAGSPPKVFIRIVADEAPGVEYRSTGIGSMILFKAMIPGRLEITDDFGITSVSAQLRIVASDSDPKDVPWEPTEIAGLREPVVEGAELEYAEDLMFDLLNFNDQEKGPDDPANPIRPGMLLSLRVEARDNFGPGEAHVGVSDELTVQVVTEEKLLQDLRRRQIEVRTQVEKIQAEERDHRDEVDQILSPISPDERASQARRRLQALARTQRGLGKQVHQASILIGRLLDEYLHNRLLDPGSLHGQRRDIEVPLADLASEAFPTSAETVEEFARLGEEDARSRSVAIYDDILVRLEAVIRAMSKLEDLAAVLDTLREIRTIQGAVKSDTQELLDKEDAGTIKKVGDGKKKDEIKKIKKPA